MTDSNPQLETYDVIVIGGGRATSLATKAAGTGARTLVIERDRLGGTCPNRGCIPSKLLIGFSEAVRSVRDSKRHFIDADFKAIDVGAMLDTVNNYTESVDGGYQQRLEAAGVEILRGDARFVDTRVLSVGDRRLTAEHIVIGTGSTPVIPAFSDLPVWTSDDVFDHLTELPDRLLIIGGGVIGSELGAFFAGIGVETDLFVRGDALLGREDADIEAAFRAEFTKHVRTHFDAELVDLSWDGNEFTATFTEGGETMTYRAERVMFATGRSPNTADLDLPATGITVGRRGVLPVNDFLDTEVPGIYGVGDVTGRLPLQHAATHHAVYLGRRIFDGMTGPIDESLVGHAIFSHPEVASVGLTEQQAIDQGASHVTVLLDWVASGRARSFRIDYPRTKLVVSTENYSILGCHMIGPEASTMIQQIITVMYLDNDVRKLARIVHVHPALPEVLLAAASAAVRKIDSGYA